MKSIFKILLITLVIITVSFSLFGCDQTEEKTLGSTMAQVQDAFQGIDGVSCRWTKEKISESGRLSVGPDAYAFYGEVILSTEYYEKITAQYEWTEYAEKTGIDFIDDISGTKDVCFCPEYSAAVSNAAFVILLLEKETKTLYFYQEN